MLSSLAKQQDSMRNYWENHSMFLFPFVKVTTNAQEVLQIRFLEKKKKQYNIILWTTLVNSLHFLSTLALEALRHLAILVLIFRIKNLLTKRKAYYRKLWKPKTDFNRQRQIYTIHRTDKDFSFVNIINIMLPATLLKTSNHTQTLHCQTV